MIAGYVRIGAEASSLGVISHGVQQGSILGLILLLVVFMHDPTSCTALISIALK